MSIIEEIAFKTIRSGGEAVEVEFKDSYDEIFPLSGPSGASLGIRLESSSKEAKSLRADLYGIAKKRRRITVDGDEYAARGGRGNLWWQPDAAFSHQPGVTGNDPAASNHALDTAARHRLHIRRRGYDGAVLPRLRHDRPAHRMRRLRFDRGRGRDQRRAAATLAPD